MSDSKAAGNEEKGATRKPVQNKQKNRSSRSGASTDLATGECSDDGRPECRGVTEIDARKERGVMGEQMQNQEPSRSDTNRQG